MMDSFNADGHMDDLERVHEVTITRGTYNLLGECSCGEWEVSTSGIALHKWERDHKAANTDPEDLEGPMERSVAQMDTSDGPLGAAERESDDLDRRESNHKALREAREAAGTAVRPVYVKYRTMYMPTNAPARTKRFNTLTDARRWINNYQVHVVGIAEGPNESAGFAAEENSR
jgi:hypothetical protein